MKFLFIVLLWSNLVIGQVIQLGIPDIAKESEELYIAQQRIKDSFAKLGYETKFVFLPTLRAHDSANKGDVDGFFPKIGKDISAYENLFLVEEPISKYSIAYSVYYIGSESGIDNWKSLDNKKIGILFGNNLSRILIEKNVKNFEILEGKSLFAMKNFMESGRVDYVLLVDTYEGEFMKMFEKKGIKKSEHPIYNTSAYLIMNKKYIGIKKKLEEEIKKSKNN